jgi:hypothetical protein
MPSRCQGPCVPITYAPITNAGMRFKKSGTKKRKHTHKKDNRLHTQEKIFAEKYLRLY